MAFPSPVGQRYEKKEKRRGRKRKERKKTSASVSRSGREVGPSIPTGGKNGVLGFEAVDLSCIQLKSHDTTADTFIVHNQIKSKVLDEKFAVGALGLKL